jgi:CxxC motif-containing protein
MSKLKELTCIVCPQGCRIKAIKKSGKHEIEGHGCKRGSEYALKETTNPERTLTTSIKVIDGELPLASVKTSKPIAKKKIKEVMKKIKAIKIKAPVQHGAIIIKNICNTKADLIATKKINKKRR